MSEPAPSFLQRRFQRLARLLSGSEPRDAEFWVRQLLIQYFFHISDRQRIEVPGSERALLNVLTPTHFKGAGRIRVAADAAFGVPRSPGSFGASYIEARTPTSLIDIGPRCVFNNRCVLISEGASLQFGADCLIGPELHAMDSNSHDLLLERRRQPDPRPADIRVGNSVFIGSRVTLLKGVSLGDGCVVAAGSVVTPGFSAPPRAILAGNPAVIVGQARSEHDAP